MITFRRFVTGFNYFMMVLFTIAAVLQYNDIDSGIWMLTYGVSALACIMWKWKPISNYWYIAIGFICLVWAFSLLILYSDQLSWYGMFDSFQMKSNSVEIIREVGGLIFVAVWMGILAYVEPVENKV